MAMASLEAMPPATANGASNAASPTPLSAVPRRVRELKAPRDASRRKPKARSGGSSAPRSTLRRHRDWREQVVSNLSDNEAFGTHIAILKILRRIPEIRDHVPRLASKDSAARTYTIKVPQYRLVPFEEEAMFMHITYREIQDVKAKLCQSVKLMYKHGVRYNIYPQNLFLYRLTFGNDARCLFLGSVTSCDLLDPDQLDWVKQRGRVREQIDRIFAPMEIWAFQDEAARLDKQATEDMRLATPIINDNNVVIDAAKADVTEARAIITEAYQAMKNARSVIDGVNAIARQAYLSIIQPQGAWEGAQFEKECVEKNRKKVDLLNARASRLIQKYGNPKMNDGMGSAEAISDINIEPEHRMVLTDSNSSVHDASRIAGEPTAQETMIQDDARTDEVILNEAALNESSSKEDGRLKT